MIDAVLKKFGFVRLDEWRKSAKVSQSQLARMIGCPNASQISSWETLKGRPSSLYVYRLFVLTKGKVCDISFWTDEDLMAARAYCLGEKEPNKFV